MKKFNVPTQMDTVLQVISKKYHIHFTRREGRYFAEWTLRNGVVWCLVCNPQTGVMIAKVIRVPARLAHRQLSQPRPRLSGFKACMELANRLLTRIAV